MFIKFIKNSDLQYKLLYKIENKTADEGHILFKKKIVMTGFRDKDIKEKIEALGCELTEIVNKNTFIVLTKNVDDTTTKLDKARELNITIMTPDVFKEKYF